MQLPSLPLSYASRLCSRDGVLLAEAVLGLAASSLAVRMLPFRRLVRRRPAIRPARDSVGVDIARLRWAVRAAARRVPFRAVCIEQSLCLLQMLRRRSVGAELHYGIGNGPGIELKAHVWLSVNGQVVLGGEAAEGFARVATFDI